MDMNRGGNKRIGVISDTHGLLRPAVLEIFKDVDLILHAGDIGAATVIETLQTVAPVVAVRGNNDSAEWAQKIPETAVAEMGRTRFYVLHDLKELHENISANQFSAVISGHSHRPSIEKHDGVVYINPGSAGPRRFKLPITVARIILKGRELQAELVDVPIA